MSRVCVEAMDNLLDKSFPVLDHGFVRVVDYMGNDTSIVQAARVSYGSGTKQINKDKALINFLMRHQHTSPFEMCEIKLHVKLPIFVARQWVRHRTANVNEYSARYSVLDNEFFVPEPNDIGKQASSNLQCREGSMSAEKASWALDIINEDAKRSYESYQKMLDNGVPRELARIGLGLNFYTQWYWKIDLHNLLRFLRLRLGQGAQSEIRNYANVITNIVKKWVPMTYDAFENYQLQSVTISAKELCLLRDLLKNKNIDFEKLGMSTGEINEFKKRFEINVPAL
ncbi:Flavin-dependent thymidylate synthase [Candidatus Xenohaliotis californiensis]|uniref:Flavin-dependent thymidylate synthase n=1 Tax=Candidatus Xenohaliotis californiensis TaxID=84677 RepID=A0ABP0ERN6_9RICK|nr:Flavin-dependent thymidylate synthase [Candidatus Xenohaliotis californiensis]